MEDNMNMDFPWSLDMMNLLWNNSPIAENTIKQAFPNLATSHNVDPNSWHVAWPSTNNIDVPCNPTVSNKKARVAVSSKKGKPETGCCCTKRSGPWSETEHRAFLLGLEKCGKGKWKKIATEFVKSRTCTQVATHAQKYFKKLQKRANGARRKGAPSIFDMDLVNGVIDHDTKEAPESTPTTMDRLPGERVEEQMSVYDDEIEKLLGILDDVVEGGCLDAEMADFWLDLPPLGELPPL